MCRRFETDAVARDAAQPALARFALPERPEPHVTASGELRCPWCDHLPTNEGFDTFWLDSDMRIVARAPVGQARASDSFQLLFGDQDMDTDTEADLRLQCPSPTCLRTFAPPKELDFDSDPVEMEFVRGEWLKVDD